MDPGNIELRILRQDGPDSSPRWEEFWIPYHSNLNVIACLMEIQKNPVTRHGTRTSPPAWEQNCLENVCGSCSMLINGRPMQACSVLVDKIAQPIVLRPLTKFPVVRIGRAHPDGSSRSTRPRVRPGEAGAPNYRALRDLRTMCVCPRSAA